MNMQIEIQKPYAFSEVGKRSNNEDCIFPEKGKATEQDKLFIVCDGMGGYERGEIASRTVCKSISSFLSETKSFDKNIFRKALNAAYDELDKIYESGQIDYKTGTTLALLYLYEKGAFIAHIGDSRIYHLRKNGDKTEIVYQSEDHSFVNDLVKSGMITPQKALMHSKRNLITRAMQPCQQQRDEAEIYEIQDIKKEDYFFLCTDGVLEALNNDELSSIFNQNVTLGEKCEMMIEACQYKSKDNFSAYLIVVNNVETE
jgi:protein phosphatase